VKSKKAKVETQIREMHSENKDVLVQKFEARIQKYTNYQSFFFQDAEFVQIELLNFQKLRDEISKEYEDLKNPPKLMTFKEKTNSLWKEINAKLQGMELANCEEKIAVYSVISAKINLQVQQLRMSILEE